MVNGERKIVNVLALVVYEKQSRFQKELMVS